MIRAKDSINMTVATHSMEGSGRGGESSAGSGNGSVSTSTSSPDTADDPSLNKERLTRHGSGIASSGGNRQLHNSHKPGLMVARRPFYGRKQELDELKKLYRESMVDTCKSKCSCPRAVVIKGVSGTGKTALVQQFVKELTQQHDSGDDELAPLILQGKYDEMLRQEPFSALEQAFGNFICDQIQLMTSNASTSSTSSEASAGTHPASDAEDPWKEQILQDIGGEKGLNVLKDIIPALSTWLRTNRRQQSRLSATKGERNPPQLPKRRVSRRESRQEEEEEDTKTTSINPSFKSNQLHYVFGKFVQALTKTTNTTTTSSNNNQKRPLLLILDDLNWMDAASMDLLAYLLSAPLEHYPFFLIGTYRTTQTDQEASRLDKLQSQDLFRSITLQNHTREEITECLSRELKCNALECNMLTSAIYERTKGNFLFTLHLVEELQRQGVLRSRQEQRKRQQRHHSMRTSDTSDSHTMSCMTTTTCNSWDDKDIVQFVEQSRTHTMVDAIADKIQHLPNPQVKQAIILASYLGTNFDVPTLQALHDTMSSEQQHQQQWHRGSIQDDPAESSSSSDNTASSSSQQNNELVKTLDVAVLEGLLYNAVGSSTYTFVHDGVREAAYNMIPAGPERDQLLYRMGHFLREQSVKASTSLSSSNHQNTLLFVAARHWSQIGAATGTPNNLVDPIELAQLYLDCGTKAKSMSAFEDAALYFDHGLNALLTLQGAVDLWAAHYHLTLQLYQSSSEMELLLGDFEKGHRLGRVVLKNARSLLEKMPSYNFMEAAMGLQDRHDEALALNMEALAELNLVPSTFMGIGDFFTVKKLINNTTDEEILALPAMTDPYLLAAGRTLGNTAMRSFLVGKPLLMVAITLRQVRRTLKLGLSPEAPLVFAGYGISLLQGMGHPNTGRRMGRLAKQLAKRQAYNEHECKTLYMVGSMIELWTEPYDEVLETYARGYELGLTSGIYDYGFTSELDAVITSFLAGKSLERISQRYHAIKQQVDQYNLDALKKVLNPFGTLLFFLTGRRPGDSKSHQNLFLNHWDSLEKIEAKKPDNSNHYTLTWAYLDRMILAFYLGNMKLAESMCKIYHDNGPDQTFFFGCLGSFYSALVQATLAHKSRSSKHKNLAHRYTKELKKLVDKGCTKLSTWHLILKAECMSITKPQKQSLVQQMYDQAIAAARDCNCVNDQALASELAGEYFLRQKRPHTAKGYLVHACSFYREWGAHEKVDQLLQKHQSTLTVDDLPHRVDENLQTDLFPVINCVGVGSSAGDCSVCDDMSALTPIPENRTLSNNNRWENGGSSNHQKERDASPPQPPSRGDAQSEDVIDKAPSKPPRRRPDVVIDTAPQCARRSPAVACQ